LYASKKDYWADWAEDARRLGSPLYRQLALGVDGNAGLKALAARARSGQPHANLLFAAVHYLLLRGAQHPLRNYYVTLAVMRLAKTFSRCFAISSWPMNAKLPR
jgi:hypothetical protein